MVVAEREGDDRSSEVLSGSEGRSLFSICGFVVLSVVVGFSSLFVS